MTTYSCSYCKKNYVRKSAFNNHKLNCQFIRICNNVKTIKDQNEFEVIDQNNELSIKFDGSINDMYKLLINMNNKFEKLQTDYNEIKKYVNITKNKIDIIEYLNKNYNSNNLDFIQFLNSIEITNTHLQIVFENDYIDGIFKIIVDYIDQIKDTINLPIKAFDNKEGIIYIYLNNDNIHYFGKEKLYNWNVLNEELIKLVLKYFNTKLLPLFQKWKLLNENKFDPDNFTMIYVKNMKTVLGTNYQKKNKNIMLQNKLYKYLKVNLKNIVTHDFI